MLILAGAAWYLQIHNDDCWPLLTLKRYPITSVSHSVCILFTYLFFSGYTSLKSLSLDLFSPFLFFSFLFLALVCEFCLSIQLYCFTIFFQLLKFGFPFHFFFKLFISCLCFFLFLLVGYNRPSVNQLSFASHFLHCSSVSTLHTLKKSTNETSSFVLSP